MRTDRDPSKRIMRLACSSCQGLGHRPDGTFLDACDTCLGTGWEKIRCPQCWTWEPVTEFMGKKGALVRRCKDCRRTYANWGEKTLEQRERATAPRAGIRSDGPLSVLFVEESGNRKTGPIPVSMTSASSCPRSCPLYNRGCYAEQHMVAIHWRRVSNKANGLDWDEFCLRIRELPEGQIWRHNEAGDLPGFDQEVDIEKLAQLVSANRGRRGFTYTHKPLDPYAKVFRRANELGFAINISTDSLADADAAAAKGLPVVTVLPHNAPSKGNKTPAGRTIVVCPAELRDEVTCERCKLCAVSERKSIIGFRAHGDRRKQITERFRQLPLIS